MKKRLIAAVVSALSVNSVQADTIGLYLGGQVWDNEVSGIFGESGNQVDFNLSDQSQGSFFVAFEHPLPLIPNAKIARTTLDTTGMTTLAKDISFGNVSFGEGVQVDSVFDVRYTDYTLYYELFDNSLFSFDLGVTARDFDGEVSVSSQVNVTTSDGQTTVSTVTGTINTNEIVPMLYASAEVDLPFTGLSAFASGNFLAIDDHTLYDYQAGLSYDLIDNVFVDLNVSVGYRAVKLELEDLEDLYTDLEFKGAFAGVTIHF